jgi:DNA polymerase-3 subunit delta'
VRFDPLPADALANQLNGIPPQTAAACARLSLGDGEKAKQLAFGDGPKLRAAAERLARAPLHRRTAQDRPWRAVLEQAGASGDAAKAQVEKALIEELEYLPKKEHKRRQTEYVDRARRAERRARTQTLDHALQLAGLWYRDLACVAAGAPELAFHADRATELTQDAENRDRHVLTTAQELVDDTRARLQVNVGFELACEALAYRLHEAL